MVLTYLEVDFEEYDITETMWKTRTNIPEEIKNYDTLPLIYTRGEIRPADLAFLKSFAERRGLGPERIPLDIYKYNYILDEW
jgi:hypothetical protein